MCRTGTARPFFHGRLPTLKRTLPRRGAATRARRAKRTRPAFTACERFFLRRRAFGTSVRFPFRIIPTSMQESDGTHENAAGHPIRHRPQAGPAAIPACGDCGRSQASRRSRLRLRATALPASPRNASINTTNDTSATVSVTCRLFGSNLKSTVCFPGATLMARKM